MTYLYIYLAVAIPLAMFACFWGGRAWDYDQAVGGAWCAALWPIILVAFLIWAPFGGMFWLGQKFG